MRRGWQLPFVAGPRLGVHPGNCRVNDGLRASCEKVLGNVQRPDLTSALALSAPHVVKYLIYVPTSWFNILSSGLGATTPRYSDPHISSPDLQVDYESLNQIEYFEVWYSNMLCRYELKTSSRCSNFHYFYAMFSSQSHIIHIPSDFKKNSMQIKIISTIRSPATTCPTINLISPPRLLLLSSRWQPSRLVRASARPT
jgi:hypothetical protein